MLRTTTLGRSIARLLAGSLLGLLLLGTAAGAAPARADGCTTGGMCPTAVIGHPVW